MVNRVPNDVTVIITCYNDGEYIEQAVRSVSNQTMLPKEIIIVDDGSTSDTLNILKNLNSDQITILFQQNQGVSNARNAGISRASTPLILVLDGDDYIENTFLEKAIGVFNSTPNVAAVSSQVKKLENNKLETPISQPIGGKVKDFLWINNSTSCAIIRKDCWVEVGGFDENMKNGYEDWEFWIAVLSNDKWHLHIIKEPLFVYRIKPISRDTKARENYDYELRAYIFKKHKHIYKRYLEFYGEQLIRINSSLKRDNLKLRESVEMKLGKIALAPLRFIKNQFKRR